MKRNIIKIIVYMSTLGVLIMLMSNMSQEGKYEEEYTKGSYNSGNLVNLIDTKDGIASLSIQGKKTLMKEGEIYRMDDNKKNYIGTVEVLEVNDDTVKVKINAEETNRYHIMNIISLLMFLLLLLLMEGPAFTLLKKRKVK